MKLLSLLLSSLLPLFISAEDESVEYGVDVSFPIHNMKVSTNYPWLPHNLDPSLPTPEEYKGMPIQYLGDKQKEYDEMIKGCSIKYPRPKRICQQTELDRVEMSKRQPQAMQNYTDIGFKKIKTPPAVWKLIKVRHLYSLSIVYTF